MVYFGIGLFFGLSLIFLRIYISQDLRVTKWQKIILTLSYLSIFIYFYYVSQTLEQMIATGLMHLLLIGTIESDLKDQKVDTIFILMFFPAILGYRFLFWQYLFWQEWIGVIGALFIGCLLCYFSKHFLSKADWLIVGYGLLLFGFKKSLVIFILSLIITVIIGGIIFLLGKGKRNLKLPYIPMYALGFWASLFLI